MRGSACWTAGAVNKANDESKAACPNVFCPAAVSGIDRYRSGRSPNGKNFPLLVGQVPASRHRARIVLAVCQLGRRAGLWLPWIQGSVRRGFIPMILAGKPLYESSWFPQTGIRIPASISFPDWQSLHFVCKFLFNMSDKDLFLWGSTGVGLTPIGILTNILSLLYFHVFPTERWSPTIGHADKKKQCRRSPWLLFPNPVFWRLRDFHTAINYGLISSVISKVCSLMLCLSINLIMGYAGYFQCDFFLFNMAALYLTVYIQIAKAARRKSVGHLMKCFDFRIYLCVRRFIFGQQLSSCAADDDFFSGERNGDCHRHRCSRPEFPSSERCMRSWTGSPSSWHLPPFL